jgi:hypothetical protein
MSGTRDALAVAFSRHFMAVPLLKMHQIFMLAFAGLRVEGAVAQVLVVLQPSPLAFLVFLLPSVFCLLIPLLFPKFAIRNSKFAISTGPMRIAISLFQEYQPFHK